jgi:hypothetical protein
MRSRPDGLVTSWLGFLPVGLACVMAAWPPTGIDAETSRDGAESQTRAESAAISGTVYDRDTGAPLSGAIVYLALRGPAARVSRQVTDDGGRFLFLYLAASESYALQASRFGYLDARLPADAGRTLRVAEGGWLRNADIRLTRLSSIAGAVFDEHGVGVAGAAVQVLAEVIVGGQPRLALGPSVTTDDLGAYEIGGLTAGSYRIVALPSRASDGSQTRHPHTFYPSSPTLAGSMTVPLTSGLHRAGIDIRVSQAGTFRLSGRASSRPSGGAVARLSLADTHGTGSVVHVASVELEDDGSFAVAGVAPGTYLIDITSQTTYLTFSPSADRLEPAAGPGLRLISTGLLPFATAGVHYRTEGSMPPASEWGRARVSVVDHDVTDVVVSLLPTYMWSGRIVVDEPPPARSPASARDLVLEPAEGDLSFGLPRARPGAAAGTFEVVGLLPTKYWLRTLSPALFVRSITRAGTDVTHEGIDPSAGPGVVVTLTPDAATISGTVRHQDGRTAPGARIWVFPAQRAARSGYGLRSPGIAFTSADEGGGHRTRVPAGSYLVVAVEASASDIPPDPAFFERLEALATPVTVSWGESVSLDLVVVRAGPSSE